MTLTLTPVPVKTESYIIHYVSKPKPVKILYVVTLQSETVFPEWKYMFNI